MERIFANLVDAWLMPLPLVLLLLGLACLMLWGKKSAASGRLLASVAWLLLFLASCTAVSDLLLLPLEERYPKWDGTNGNLAFVVVMGASQQQTPRLPETNRLNSAGMYRLLEGIAVYRANPASKLIVSGGGGEQQSFAEVAARVAEILGVPAEDILTQPYSHNTEQEVGLLAPMVGQQPFAVVTSAAHMPRTMNLFAAAGLHPLAVPTHFQDRFNPHPNWRDFTLPSADSLLRAQFALHEYIGMLWLRIKGLAS